MVPNQQYYNGAYTEDTVHDITTKIRHLKKLQLLIEMQFRAPSIKKQSRHNIMHILFYSNISEFSGNLQGMLHEERYKTSIKNMHKIGWKAI